MSNKQSPQVSFVAIQTELDERLSFVAAALACGFELAENTPKISNVYSVEKKYERGQQGDVRMMVEARSKSGLSLPSVIEVWKEGDEVMKLATELPRRISGAKTHQDRLELLQGDSEEYWCGIESVVVGCAVAYMKLFSLGRVKLPNTEPVTAEENNAALFFDSLPRQLSTPQAENYKFRKKLADEASKKWQASMVAWLKAFVIHYRSLINLWREAPQSIKIDRGKGKLPLVLEKGPKFKEMLRRWT